MAQDPTTTTTAAPTTTPPQPSRPIPLKQYRPKAVDFLVNIDAVPVLALSLRKSEPLICNKLRLYLESEMKKVHETVLSDVKRVSSAIATSGREATIADVSVAARNAIQLVYTEIANFSNTSLYYINGNCSLLNTTVLLNQTLQGLESWRQAQLNNTVRLAQMPVSLEAKMQGNYAIIEKVIGTNF